ncbi:unnamed protein product [Nezara viridula]|uniref:Uncharacterized protein n=1 Tax=Nezara viridula TaxID=85310 RepID=A0A9P0MTB7_NEZVI|nr:unnamed protein product [Nezara viridula]
MNLILILIPDVPGWTERNSDGVYIGTIEERRVTPSIEPGYLRPLLPSSAPVQPEPWDDIMSDIEKYIMPGVRIRNYIQ